VKQRAESQQTVRAWLRFARFAARLGDADSAQTAFETAIVLDDGKTVEPYLQAAKFAEDLGDLDQALRRLRQAYEIDPGDPRVTQRLRELGEVPGPTIGLPPGK
jgi:tetratricopeptide (TPR) repeat protein